jgi:hypothetical protein
MNMPSMRRMIEIVPSDLTLPAYPLLDHEVNTRQSSFPPFVRCDFSDTIRFDRRTPITTKTKKDEPGIGVTLLLFLAPTFLISGDVIRIIHRKSNLLKCNLFGLRFRQISPR